MNDLNLGESIDSIGEDTKGGTKDQSLTNGIGTKESVSPEQMSNTSYDQSTDVYSLGLIFLYIFSPTSTQSEKLDQLKNENQLLLEKLRNYESTAPLVERNYERPDIYTKDNTKMQTTPKGTKYEKRYPEYDENVAEQLENLIKIIGSLKQDNGRCNYYSALMILDVII